MQANPAKNVNGGKARGNQQFKEIAVDLPFKDKGKSFEHSIAHILETHPLEECHLACLMISICVPPFDFFVFFFSLPI